MIRLKITSEDLSIKEIITINDIGFFEYMVSRNLLTRSVACNSCNGDVEVKIEMEV